MSNTRCSLKGCSAVGNALLVSPEVKHILSTSNLTRLQSYWLSPEQSISYSQFFYVLWDLKKQSKTKNPIVQANINQNLKVEEMNTNHLI